MEEKKLAISFIADVKSIQWYFDTNSFDILKKL